MPRTLDFRNYAFDTSRVDASGKHVGRWVFWKLYAVENIVRVIMHSILSAQVGSNWWSVAVDADLQKEVRRRIVNYSKQPWYSTPGKHEIYYAYLSDLNKIMAVNSHLFVPHIPDIDKWVAKIEEIRVPRNVVGHMNWLSATDRHRIDVFHADIQHLVDHLATNLAAKGISLTIP